MMDVCHAVQKPGCENRGDYIQGQSDRESGLVLRPSQLRLLKCLQSDRIDLGSRRGNGDKGWNPGNTFFMDSLMRPLTQQIVTDTFTPTEVAVVHGSIKFCSVTWASRWAS